MVLLRNILKRWHFLNPAERLVYAALWLRADGHGECYPNILRIAGDTGFGRTAVNAAIKKLCMLGIVRKSKNRPEHSTVYKVYDLERWGNETATKKV